MEPYRVSGFRCPTCPETPLREFQDRLICNECHGIMLDEKDYVASCADLGARAFTLERTNETPTTTGCPRCERAMTSVHTVLAPIKVSADVLRCERDGLWLAGGQITRVFALVSRRTGSQGGAYYSQTGRIGLDELPVSRHGPASGSLAISDWRSRPRRRAPTVTPINLYGEQKLPCPACTTSELRFVGDRYACELCTGTFVQNDALESMVMDISKALWDVPAPTGTAGARACPVCTKTMVVEDLERVPIDRCAEHGVWFDLHELTVALENASHQFDPRGIRAWIKKLFTRDAAD